MELIKFQQSHADPCVYVRIADLMTVVAVYVDDLILITETMKEMKKNEVKAGDSIQNDRYGKVTLLSWDHSCTR